METALTSGLNPSFGHVINSFWLTGQVRQNANTKMSSGVVRSALHSVLENSLLKAVASERSRKTLDLGKLLLETLSKDEDSFDVFDTLSHNLLVALKALLPAKASTASLQTRQERLWTKYRKFISVYITLCAIDYPRDSLTELTNPATTKHSQ